MNLSLANPYDVADWALQAYRSQNLESYNQVLLNPAPSNTIFTYSDQLTEEDKVQSLYFQDDKGKEIAAVIRLGNQESPSIYFSLIRKDGSFFVEDLLITQDAPDTEISVEGF